MKKKLTVRGINALKPAEVLGEAIRHMGHSEEFRTSACG